VRRFIVPLLAGAALAAAPAGALAASELSISDRLEQRRYVAAGERAYVMGFQDGRFYAQGWHIHGEMGGVWTQPLKLIDGLWFSTRAALRSAVSRSGTRCRGARATSSCTWTAAAPGRHVARRTAASR
jgi:hypothetical protein